MRLSRVFLWAMAATITLTVGVPIVSLWPPVAMPSPMELVALGIVILIYIVIGLSCAVALEKGRAPWLMRSGIIVGLLAWIGWFASARWQGPSMIWQKVLCWPTTWAFLMMVVAWLLLPRATVRWWVLLRRITFVLLGILAVHICVAVACYPEYEYSSASDFDWSYQRKYEDVVFRIGGVLTMLAAGGVAATLLGVLATRGGAPAQPLQRLPFGLTCPRCGARQTAMTGVHHCEQCRLQIRVELT